MPRGITNKYLPGRYEWDGDYDDAWIIDPNGDRVADYDVENMLNNYADAIAALKEIRNGRLPQVCEEYQICEHIGCNASYSAFAIADGYFNSHDKCPKNSDEVTIHQPGCPMFEDE